MIACLYIYLFIWQFRSCRLILDGIVVYGLIQVVIVKLAYEI